jgi:MYXO-CTERM domain-containing protein
MNRIHLLIGILLLTMASYAQPPDPTRNPNSDTYNRPVEYTSGYGNWGLLGLFGLAGLLGLRRRETIIRNRDEFSTEQRRRAS